MSPDFGREIDGVRSFLPPRGVFDGFEEAQVPLFVVAFVVVVVVAFFKVVVVFTRRASSSSFIMFAKKR